jgi:predicted MPP superfamily phosphohydrolase
VELIWTEILVYNFVMLGLSMIAGVIMWRRQSVVGRLCVILLSVLAAALLAVLIGSVPFESLHLLCYGWFVYVPLVILLAAILGWRTHRVWSVVALLVVAALTAVAVDAFWIEPQWLEVTTVHLRSDKVTRPWRAVLIADLQTDQVSDYERRVFEEVRRARPDLILLAGDYLQIRSEDFPNLRAKFNAYLREVGLNAPLGIYAVGGNTDTEGWQRIFSGVPVTCFEHTRRCAAGELDVIGLSMPDSFDTTLTIPDDARFQIVVGHGPDFALGDVQADLLLAGHTHGGQVQLPLVGPLITLSKVPRAWASGVTYLDSRRTLIVSRGIGMERMGAPRLRFLCRPQLVIIEIQPTPRAASLTGTGWSSAGR